MELTLRAFELRVSFESFFLAIPRLGEVFVEFRYPARTGRPWFERERYSAGVALWAGRTHVVLDRA